MRQKFTQEFDFRQLRDFGQKISASFEFIGEHWRGLGRALVYIVLPAALLQGIIAVLLRQTWLAGGAHQPASTVGYNGVAETFYLLSTLRDSPYYWVNVAVSAVFAVLLVLTVYGYLLCCLRPAPSPAPITVREVWAVVQRHFLGSFIAYFGLVAIVVIGMFFLLIPGIYLAVALSLFYVVKVVENTGFGDTFQRCLQLTRGKWWSSFGLFLVMGLMFLLLVTVVSGVASSLLLWLLYSVLGLSSMNGGGSALLLLSVITSGLTGIFKLLIYPPLLMAVAFQYFNLVERHDGVGLRSLIDQLGQAPAPVRNATYQPDEEGEY